MRVALFLTLLTCSLAVSPILEAQDKPGVEVFPIACTASSHAHRASDYRIALIKVLEVTACGFRYEDLEEHSVAAEGITTDRQLFKLGSVQFESKLMTVTLVPTEIKKGAFGVLVYCSYCRAGLLMETTKVGK